VAQSLSPLESAFSNYIIITNIIQLIF